MYDGLGRLVRTQSPAAGGGSSVRTERFYYDGLRRIQEFVTEPLTPLAGIDGDPTLEAMAEQTVSPQTNPDAQSAPTGFEQQQLGGGIGGGAPGGSIAREYVWGPGDSGPGFDELLVQYDENGEEAWAIQDAGGDLVALCDLGGGPGGGGGGGTPDLARVVGQWTFDAYGEVLTAEHLFAFALPHLGHKGLFLDRLDGDGSSPRLVPFGHAVYHMRNRAYAPGLGRFLQRDPNQTAMALAESAAMHGRGLGALSLAFDLEGLYGDGGNLYEYLGGNPWARHDILGLSVDPFDVVDEFWADHNIREALFLDTIGAGVHAFAIITYTIVAMCPIPIIPDLALYATGAQGIGATVFGSALGLIPGGRLVGAAGRWLGRVRGLVRASSLASRNAHLIGTTIRVGGRMVTVTAEMAQHVGKLLPSYTEAQQLTRGFNHAIEGHHLVPSAFMHLVGLDNGTVPAVILLWGEHQAIEALIRAAKGRLGREVRTLADLEHVLRDAYSDFPEYWSAIARFF